MLNDVDKEPSEGRFPGFPRNMEAEFWKYPRMLEGYWYLLTGIEQKLLDFILRQTIGWIDTKTGRRKKSDRISLSQFQTGIGKNNKGTGLSKNSVIKGLKGLIEKGFIEKEAGKAFGGASRYKLVVQEMNTDSSQNEQESGSRNEQAGGSRNEHTIENFKTDIEREETIETIGNCFCEKIFSGKKIDENAKNLISERLKSFSTGQILEAIALFSKSPWWMEKNRHLGAKWFFKDDDQIEKFLNIKSFPKISSENQNKKRLEDEEEKRVMERMFAPKESSGLRLTKPFYGRR